jgi:hypothetical protein
MLAFCVIFAFIGFGVGFAFFLQSEEIVISVRSVIINLILFSILMIVLMPIESKIHSAIFTLGTMGGAIFGAHTYQGISLILLASIVLFFGIVAYNLAKIFSPIINKLYGV